MRFLGVVFFPLACSSRAPGDTEADDRSTISPSSLNITALPGGHGVLDVVALTLQPTPQGAELYATLRNDGAAPACSAAFSVELFDANAQSLAAGIGGLLTQHFYRLTDGSNTIAACVGPGDVTAAALTDFSSDFAAEDVETVVYRCPYFALDVEPVDGPTIQHVTPVHNNEGTTYSGTLLNRFDVAVRQPSVTVFSLDRAGRPLGVATDRSTTDIAPGEEWHFETDNAAVNGTNYLAFSAGALAK